MTHPPKQGQPRHLTPPELGRDLSESYPSDHRVPLLDYFSRLLWEMELRHDQHIEALDRLIDVRLTELRALIDSHAMNVSVALTSADKAVSKAEAATERRFESVNEFRQTLSDQTKNFIGKVEFEALREASAARIADLSSRLDKTEGKAVGLNAGWVYLLGALAVASTLISIGIAIFLKGG
jgi:hypothetical protein